MTFDEKYKQLREKYVIEDLTLVEELQKTLDDLNNECFDGEHEIKVVQIDGDETIHGGELVYKIEYCIIIDGNEYKYEEYMEKLNKIYDLAVIKNKIRNIYGNI